jgi:hypothetical protein
MTAYDSQSRTSSVNQNSECCDLWYMTMRLTYLATTKNGSCAIENLTRMLSTITYTCNIYVTTKVRNWQICRFVDKSEESPLLSSHKSADLSTKVRNSHICRPLATKVRNCYSTTINLSNFKVEINNSGIYILTTTQAINMKFFFA